MKISKSQTDKAVLISGATDYFGLHFTYDEEFASLEEVKTCEFFKNRKTVKVDLVDGYCAVPNEILRDKNPFEMRVVSGNTVGTPWFAVAITEGGIINNDDEPEELAPMGTAYVKTLTGENNISMIRDNDGAFEYSKDGQNWKSVNSATTNNGNSENVESPIISDEQIDERIESCLSDKDYATNADIENKIDKIVATKIEKAVNSISNPFDKAYWKDSSDGCIYLVTMTNGALKITKQGDTGGSDTPSDPIVPPVAGELEDILEDRLLIWHDEFEGDSLNTDNWKYEIGYYRNNEPQYYKEENVEVSNSICKITAKKETVIDESTGKTYNWTSGSIQTANKKMFRKGRVEAKIRFSNIGGEWGAFWLLGFGAPWSICGETDICEIWGTGENKGTYNIHYVESSCSNKTLGATKYNLKITDWNIFAAEIDADNITFYLNGNQVGVFNHTDPNINYFYNAGSSDSMLNPFLTLQKYIKLNLALQPEDSANYPQGSEDRIMEIDWVRVYAPVDKTEIAETTSLKMVVPSFLWSTTQGDITVDVSKLKKYKDRYCLALNVFGNDGEAVMGYTVTSSDISIASPGLEVDGGINGILIKKDGEVTLTATTPDGLTYSHKFIFTNFS